MFVILVTDSEFVKLSCDVIGGATFDVLIRVCPIADGSRTCSLGALLSMIGLIIAMPAIYGFMIGLDADLAKGLGAACASLLLLGSSIAATPSIGRAMATTPSMASMTTTSAGIPTTT